MSPPHANKDNHNMSPPTNNPM